MRSEIRPYLETMDNWTEPNLYVSNHDDVILIYEDSDNGYVKGVVLYADPSSVLRVGEHDEWRKGQLSRYHGEVIIKSR